MNTRSARFRSSWVPRSAIALAAMSLAACAGPAANASNPQAPARPHVRIGGFAAGAGSIAIVMQKLGVFQSQGIDAEFVIFPDSTVATSALISGQIDYLVASNDRPVINAEAGGPPLKVVIGLAQRPPWTWIVHPESTLNPGDPISRLKGLSIGDGGPNTTQRYAERYLLTQAGLDPDRDVTFRTMPQNAVAATAAFEHHAVDVLSAIEPTTSSLLSRGTGRTYLDLRAPGSPAAFASKESLVARADYIQGNHAAVQDVVSAACRGVQKAKSNPSEVAGLLIDYYRTQGLTFDRGPMLQGIIADSARWGGNLDRSQWSQWESLLEQRGIVKHHYTFDGVVATEFAPEWSCATS